MLGLLNIEGGIILFGKRILPVSVLFILFCTSPLRTSSEAFLKYSGPVPKDYKIYMPQYFLPLDIAKILNLQKFKELNLNIVESKEKLKRKDFEGLIDKKVSILHKQ